jgi:hypothetical protein
MKCLSNQIESKFILFNSKKNLIYLQDKKCSFQPKTFNELLSSLK